MPEILEKKKFPRAQLFYGGLGHFSILSLHETTKGPGYKKTAKFKRDPLVSNLIGCVDGGQPDRLHLLLEASRKDHLAVALPQQPVHLQS